MTPLCLPGKTRLARAMVCISVWLRIGLSRYTVEQLGASKPVSHMAQTKTSRSGSSVSLNFSSSPGCDSFMRLRCGSMSRPSVCICCDFVLARRDDHRHVGGGQHRQPLLQLGHAQVAPRLFGGHATARLVMQFAQFLLHSCSSAAQCTFTLSYMRSAVALSIDTTIALPTKPRPRKCRTMSCATVSSRSSRVIRWYCRAQLALQLGLLLRVELGVLDQAVDVVVQVGIDELQLGCAVLVEQRHRGPVLDGLLEVVDRDVVAEDFLGASPHRQSAACR